MPSRRENESIDAYLRLFEAYTSSIPDAERETAVCEIRQHLESLVTDFEAEGCSPAKAAAKAVEKFGSVKNVSRRIVWEYWRKRTQLICRWTGILAAWSSIGYGFIRLLDGTFMPGLQGWQFFVLASVFGGILGGLRAISSAAFQQALEQAAENPVFRV